jgi:hypothetical protein
MLDLLPDHFPEQSIITALVATAGYEHNRGLAAAESRLQGADIGGLGIVDKPDPVNGRHLGHAMGRRFKPGQTADNGCLAATMQRGREDGGSGIQLIDRGMQPGGAEIIECLILRAALLRPEDYLAIKDSASHPAFRPKLHRLTPMIQRRCRAHRIIGAENGDIAGLLRAKQVHLGVRCKPQANHGGQDDPAKY